MLQQRGSIAQDGDLASAIIAACIEVGAGPFDREKVQAQLDEEREAAALQDEAGMAFAGVVLILGHYEESTAGGAKIGWHLAAAGAWVSWNVFVTTGTYTGDTFVYSVDSTSDRDELLAMLRLAATQKT